MNRFADRLLAALMIVIGTACFIEAYLALGEACSRGAERPQFHRRQTGNQLAMFDSQSGPIYAVAFAAGGTVLTGGYDRSIRDWPAGGADRMVLFAGAPD
ncbi:MULTISPECIES: WD40 repeat domain-containing protein [unclassified Mesorhizobium]|uniref:WD40 repeat domain-containing protein n=1 Tax=unclassified Mesorhizobium TaxID=325217 RepID=UPI00333B65E3